MCADGGQCELGKPTQRERRWYGTFLDKMSRERADHDCVPIGHGVAIFNFVIEIDGFGHLDIFEGLGSQLLDMSDVQWF